MGKLGLTKREAKLGSSKIGEEGFRQRQGTGRHASLNSREPEGVQLSIIGEKGYPDNFRGGAWEVLGQKRTPKKHSVRRKRWGSLRFDYPRKKEELTLFGEKGRKWETGISKMKPC